MLGALETHARMWQVASRWETQVGAIISVWFLLQTCHFPALPPAHKWSPSGLEHTHSENLLKLQDLDIYWVYIISQLLSHCMLYCIPQRTNKYCYYFKIILIYCFSFHTWSVAFLQHFKYHVPLKDPLHHAKFNFLHFQPESKSNEHSHSVQSKWMSYNLIQIYWVTFL